MIAGVDLSTRAIDIVLLDETTDAATWHRFELEGMDAFDRARDVAMKVPGRAMSFWDDVLAVGIEDPRGYGAGALYRVQGVVLGCIPNRLLVQPWIPSAWRKQVGLAGNAPKERAHDLARTRMYWVDGVERVWPLDATDAYCIALATRSRIERIAA